MIDYKKWTTTELEAALAIIEEELAHRTGTYRMRVIVAPGVAEIVSGQNVIRVVGSQDNSSDGDSSK